ncbi:hypothetical protein L9F63_012393, partial [Diploptera punctata]
CGPCPLPLRSARSPVQTVMNGATASNNQDRLKRLQPDGNHHRINLQINQIKLTIKTTTLYRR